MVPQQIVYHPRLVHGNPPAVEGIVLEDGAALLLVVAADIHRRHPAGHLLDPRAVAVKKVQCTSEVRCNCPEAVENVTGTRPGLKDWRYITAVK